MRDQQYEKQLILDTAVQTNNIATVKQLLQQPELFDRIAVLNHLRNAVHAKHSEMIYVFLRAGFVPEKGSPLETELSRSRDYFSAKQRAERDAFLDIGLNAARQGGAIQMIQRAPRGAHVKEIHSSVSFIEPPTAFFIRDQKKSSSSSPPDYAAACDPLSQEVQVTIKHAGEVVAVLKEPPSAIAPPPPYPPEQSAKQKEESSALPLPPPYSPPAAEQAAVITPAGAQPALPPVEDLIRYSAVATKGEGEGRRPRLLDTHGPNVKELAVQELEAKGLYLHGSKQS